jgi:hypothetical protein
MPVIPLPFEQIKLFRAFVRAEYLTFEARLVARPWPLQFVSFDIYCGMAWRLWKKSRELGLPWPAARRAAEAEVDTIHAPKDLGGGRAS